MLHEIAKILDKDIDRTQRDCERQGPEHLNQHDHGEREHPHTEAFRVDKVERAKRDQAEDKARHTGNDGRRRQDDLREGDLLHHLPFAANRLCCACNCHGEPAPREDGGKEEEWEGRFRATEDDANEEVVNGELKRWVKDQPRVPED